MLSAKLSSLRFQRGVAGGQRTSSGLERVREGQLIDLGDRHEKEVDEVVFGDAHRDAGLVGGPGRADGARGADSDREKVRCASPRQLC